MYILKQVNFAELLSRPVMSFLYSLNGTEEDRQAFKERAKATSGVEDVSDNASSNYLMKGKSRTMGSGVPSQKMQEM